MDSGLRRNLFIGLGGIAVAAVVVAIIVTLVAPDNTVGWLIGALAVLVITLVAEVVLLFMRTDAPRAPKKKHATPPRPQVGPAGATGDDMLMRCSNCRQTFTTFDDGRRPLATMCPHCGQRGVIEAPAA